MRDEMGAAVEVAAAAPVGLAVAAQSLPQTTAKRDSQRENPLPQTTAKPIGAARSFAVVESLIDDADLDADLDLFQDVDSKIWRIEKRYRVRQDGRRVMYYNFRRREIKRVDGKQRVEYLTGGRRIVA